MKRKPTKPQQETTTETAPTESKPLKVAESRRNNANRERQKRRTIQALLITKHGKRKPRHDKSDEHKQGNDRTPAKAREPKRSQPSKSQAVLLDRQKTDRKPQTPKHEKSNGNGKTVEHLPK